MKHTSRFLAILIAITFVFSAPVSAEQESDLHSNIHSLLELLFKDSYYYKIEGNESGYVIYVAYEGVAASVFLTEMGMLPRDYWQEYIDATVEWADSISEFLAVCGAENPNVLFILVDDFEMKETLLVIYNGQVIFDYVPAK